MVLVTFFAKFFCLRDWCGCDIAFCPCSYLCDTIDCVIFSLTYFYLTVGEAMTFFVTNFIVTNGEVLQQPLVLFELP